MMATARERGVWNDFLAANQLYLPYILKLAPNGHLVMQMTLIEVKHAWRDLENGFFTLITQMDHLHQQLHFNSIAR